MAGDHTTRRGILIGTAGAASALTLAACSPVQIQRSGQEGAPSSQKGKVTWLVRTTPAENKGQEQAFEPAIKRVLPGVEIERVVVPQAQYIPKINAMAAANESLEIWGFGGNYYDYWWRKLPEDLTPFINADKWDVQTYFQPGLMDIYKINNKFYGLAQLSTFGSMLLYNKDMFDRAQLKYPPVDWDDASWTVDKMLEYALKLTKNYGKPDGEYGVMMSLWASMTSWPYLWGSDAWTPEHYTQFIAQKTNFNSDAVLQSHTFVQDLVYKHQVMPDPAVTKSLEQVGSPFETGRVAMSLDGGWQYWTTSQIKDFKFGYAALPTAKANKNINFDDFWIMGRWSKNKDLAWKVMRALTSVEAVNEYTRVSFTPPTPRAALQPWLEQVSKASGQPLGDLQKVTTGAIEKKRSQESPDHIFLQHPKISDTYDQEKAALMNNGEKPAAWVPRVAKIMDETVKGIYDQFKDSRPKD